MPAKKRTIKKTRRTAKKPVAKRRVARPKAKARSQNFVSFIKTVLEKHKAIGFNPKERIKDWTHPKTRKAIEAEIGKRIFRGTSLNSKTLLKLFRTENAPKAFARMKRIPLEKAWPQLIAELRKVNSNSRPLYALSERISKKEKQSKWDGEANDALGHIMSPVAGRAKLLLGRIGG